MSSNQINKSEKVEEIYINIGGKTLKGLRAKEDPYYYDCRDVFENECTPVIGKEFTINDLKQFKGTEIPESTCFCFGYHSESYNHAFYASLARKKGKLICSISADYPIHKWFEDVNLMKFIPTFTKALSSNTDYRIKSNLDLEDNMSWVSAESSVDEYNKVSDLLDCIVKDLKKYHEQCIHSLSNSPDFISQFKFPEEYKHTFIKYLTQFGKFLEDLGINGDISITNDGKVTKLFFKSEENTIQDQQDIVLSALQTYLNLPSSGMDQLLTSTGEVQSEIRLQQLQATIQHLKSELSLANALVSVKNTELRLLSQEADTKVINTSPSEEIVDYWEPIEGIKLTPYKGRFFSIDIPLIIRKLSKK